MATDFNDENGYEFYRPCLKTRWKNAHFGSEIGSENRLCLLVVSQAWPIKKEELGNISPN